MRHSFVICLNAAGSPVILHPHKFNDVRLRKELAREGVMFVNFVLTSLKTFRCGKAGEAGGRGLGTVGSQYSYLTAALASDSMAPNNRHL
jgi:hypothetical protein